jgi:nitrogen fixation NifU-like protein
MYQEVILDYYRNPRNFGIVADPDIHVRDTNPLCGDEIEVSAKIVDGKISEVRFKGKGCAISQAAASMLTELVHGKTLQEIKAVSKEQMLELLSIPVSPVRLKCALLGLKVFKLGLYKYLGEVEYG